MKIFIILITLIISGCVTKPIPVVYQCPIINLPQEPKSYTSTLTDSSSPDRVVKSYVADLAAYKSWCHAIQKQINY